jgi:hypothetical protein
VTIFHFKGFELSGSRVNQVLAGVFRSLLYQIGILQTTNGGIGGESPRIEVMGLSAQPIERATREPRMDPQSTVFPSQPCCH